MESLTDEDSDTEEILCQIHVSIALYISTIIMTTKEVFD